MDLMSSLDSHEVFYRANVDGDRGFVEPRKPVERVEKPMNAVVAPAKVREHRSPHQRPVMEQTPERRAPVASQCASKSPVEVAKPRDMDAIFDRMNEISERMGGYLDAVASAGNQDRSIGD